MKAISIWSFAGKTVREAMNLAKDAGFDGIELSLNETGECSLTAPPEELAALRSYAEAIGLKIHSVATGLYWSYSLTANDENTRKKALDIATRQLHMAAALGANSVLIVPGAVGVDFIPGFEVVDYEEAYNRSLAAFMKLKPLAESLKIHIGIENVWNKFLLSPLEMRGFIEQINSPYIGAYLDVGNVVLTGYPEQWVRILGRHIKKVHFKDYRRDAGGLSGFVDLLAGDVDWGKVMQAFSDIGYQGWFTAEMLPPYAQHSEQILYNTAASMDCILNTKGRK